MTLPRRARRRTPGRPARLAAASALAIATLTNAGGCGREFFREWADQDVTEAVFEKSRDPRWRVDLFSIESPALARYADPYDPDRPPAPPDDYATEALSPVAQNPHHRLLVPVEGTGYIDMLDRWQRQRPPVNFVEQIPDSGPSAVVPPEGPDGESPFRREPTESSAEPPADPDTPPPPPPVDEPGEMPELGAPAAPGENLGPAAPALSPTSGGGGATPPAAGPPAAATPSRPPAAPLAQSPAPEPRQDPAVLSVAFHQDPAPVQPGADVPEPANAPLPADPFLDPRGIGEGDADPRAAIPGSILEPSPEQTDALIEKLQVKNLPFDEAAAAGLGPNARPYVIAPDQALTLALINSRAYQFQLEDVYIAGLGVTFQRFQLEPQVFAGLSPSAQPAAGGIGVNPGTSYLYRTRETGNPTSLLNIGTAAGVGKVLSFGTRIAGGFANQTILNFTGSNIRRPTVQSFLPLQVVQPFLRGGGRTVTLEALTQAERNLLYEVRDLARFRQEFFPSILTFGAGITIAGGGDGSVGFLQVLNQQQIVENGARNVAAFERILLVFQELALSPASGVAPLDIIQIESQLQTAKNQLLIQRNQYQSFLDQYKIQLGLPPDLPLVPDRGLLTGFREVFNAIDNLSVKPRDILTELVADLPPLEDVVIDGRPVVELTGKVEKLEDLLLAAERVALTNRVDLMNARARLYDAWRQLAFTANQLKGVFNVSVSNQFQTPPTTTNPFGFNDQTSQFALTLNAELPLIRLAERNAYQQAQINYHRQRRALMQAEDQVKLQVRNGVRNLQVQARSYEIQKIQFIVNLIQNDQSLQNFIAPPAGAGGGAGGGSNTNTLFLVTAQNQINGTQNQLVLIWTTYQSQRIALYRDLGILPYDEWEAFDELFPTAPTERPGDGDRDGGPVPGPAAAPAVGPAAAVEAAPGGGGGGPG